MIYTVAPDSTLDITWGVLRWKRGSTTCATDIIENPGEEDFNVARVAGQPDASAYVLGPLGGMTRERVRKLFVSPIPRMQTR